MSSTRASQSDDTEMKVINLDTTFVPHPKRDHHYHIPCENMPNGGASFAFTGDAVEKYDFVDVASFTCKKDIAEEKTVSSRSEHFHFIAKDSLPLDMRTADLPPVLLYLKKHPNRLVAPTIFLLTMDSKCNSFEWDEAYFAANVNVCNNTIVADYQTALAPFGKFATLPILAGSYPIFTESKRPSYEFLASLYQQFINYNTEEKLRYQQEKSPSMCNVRAHFATLLLNHYGIPTEKVIKYWKKGSWQNTSPEQQYTFHMSTVITDSNNRKWVWEPWEGQCKYLQPLEQWLDRQNEPKPIKLMITNSAVVANFKLTSKNSSADGSNFTSSPLIPKQYFNAFQAISVDAIPNRPKRPLTLFFKIPADSKENVTTNKTDSEPVNQFKRIKYNHHR